MVVAILALAAYLFVPAYFYVSADALVQGDLVPVTPLYRARVDRLLVRCDDRVRAGQTLAVISNFLVQADYEQQYEKSLVDLNLSKIALDQGVAAARSEEETARERYVAAGIQTRRLLEDFQGYDRAYRAGAVGRAEWAARRADWQAAVATAQGASETWARAKQHVSRVQGDQETKVAADRQSSERVQALARRVSSEPLRATVGGYIVNCVDRPENVVDPSVPIFDIFDPRRAYVLAYFDPDAMDKVRVGAPVEVQVHGLSGSLAGRVASIHPTLNKLPDELTRFFWQHVQWSEYRPVRIALDGISPQLREQLYYGAQTRVRIRIRREWHPFEVVGLSQRK